MRTNRLFVALAFALAVSGSSVFAQPGPAERQAVPQHRNFTPEQMTEFRTKQIQDRLMLDDKTAAKFAPLYKEYLEAVKECMKTAWKERKKGERTDEEILKEMEERIDRQQKMLDIRKKYFNSFKKILTPRQLEKVFTPGPRHFGPKAWQRPKGDWKESRRDRPHHRFCQPETCPRIEAED